MKKRLLGLLRPLGVFLVVLTTLLLTVRGLPGNVTQEDINGPGWIGGPFELSVERGRFALTFSIAENHSFFFTVPIARFATPDLGYARNQYVSLFAPAVSVLTVCQTINNGGITF